MPTFTLPTFRTTFGLLLLLGSTAFASDPIGIYAVVDKVSFEPSDTAPERIQIFGRFALAEGRREYAPVKKGYLYCKIGENPEAVRKEWNDLKSVAGSGQIVAFGSRSKALPKVREAGAKLADPDPYPIGFGMQKVKATDYKPLNDLKAAAPR